MLDHVNDIRQPPVLCIWLATPTKHSRWEPGTERQRRTVNTRSQLTLWHRSTALRMSSTSCPCRPLLPIVTYSAALPASLAGVQWSGRAAIGAPSTAAASLSSCSACAGSTTVSGLSALCKVASLSEGRIHGPLDCRATAAGVCLCTQSVVEQVTACTQC